MFQGEEVLWIKMLVWVFILASGRGFLSDLQSIDLCSVTKVSLNFLPAWGYGCAGFVCASDAQMGAAVEINQEIRFMELQELREVCKLHPLKMSSLTS